MSTNMLPYCCPQTKCNIAMGYVGSHNRWDVTTPIMYYIYGKELLNVTYSLQTAFISTWDLDDQPGWPNFGTNCESLGRYQWAHYYVEGAVCYNTSAPISTTGTWGGTAPFGKDDNFVWGDIVGGPWNVRDVWPPNETDFYNNDGLRHGFNNINFSYDYRTELLDATVAQDAQNEMDAAALSLSGPATDPANDPDFRSEVMANVNIGGLSSTWQSGPINGDTAQVVGDTYPVTQNHLPQGQHQFWRTKSHSAAQYFWFSMDAHMGHPSLCMCCDFIESNSTEEHLDLYDVLGDL